MSFCFWKKKINSGKKMEKKFSWVSFFISVVSIREKKKFPLWKKKKLVVF